MTDLTPSGRRPADSGTVYGAAAVPDPAGRPQPRHHRRSARGRPALVALLLLAVTAGVIFGGQRLSERFRPTAGTSAGAGSGASPNPSAGTTSRVATKPSLPAEPVPLLGPHPVDVKVDGFFSWALMDRRSGAITGSPNSSSGTSSTESMIKTWIASDYLRRQAVVGSTPTRARLAELSTMIRDSDDHAAQDIYEIGGGNAVVARMIKTCGLKRTTVYNYWWSKTNITAADATRLGLCVADGRAAGKTWTPWILAEMRAVRGEGRFGPITALPAADAKPVAIKNGWTLIVADGDWHVACLAVADQWILAVLTRYSGKRGLTYGADVCAKVTRQLTNRP